MQRTAGRKSAALVVSLLLVWALTHAPVRGQSGGTYSISRPTLSGGGGASAQGATRLEGSVGQPAAGASAGGAYVVAGGLFAGAGGTTPPATHSLGGRVTLAANGAPVANVQITLTGAASSTLTTDAGGSYLFNGLPAGAYTVTPARAGFVLSPSSRSVALAADTDDADFAATPTLVNPGPANGPVLITEFRLSGLTPDDEFIELYNNTDSDIALGGYRLDSPAGYTVRPPAVAVIPARGHYLVAHAAGYTLSAYAAPDLVYSDFELPADTGLALLDASGRVVDAVGPISTPPPYREGTGVPAAGQPAAQYSFVRDTAAGGLPADTGDNAADFLLVSTGGVVIGGAQTRLGAPGPEGLSSPTNRNPSFGFALLDPSASLSAPPNRARDFTPAGNATFGTLTIRRVFTNYTGAPVRLLRFRIIRVTTFPPPSGATADLRALDSADTRVTVGGVPVDVRGTTVERPPAQPSGGGWNTTLSVGSVSLAQPLADGASAAVQFTLGVEQPGLFRFYVNVEASGEGRAMFQGRPKPRPPIWESR